MQIRMQNCWWSDYAFTSRGNQSGDPATMALQKKRKARCHFGGTALNIISAKAAFCVKDGPK